MSKITFLGAGSTIFANVVAIADLPVPVPASNIMYL